MTESEITELPGRNGPEVYLASSSPRRQELLRQIGVRFEVLPVDVDETPEPGEEPAAYVLRMAASKASAGLDRVSKNHNAVVLGADTSVIMNGQILGKPSSVEDAIAQLQTLSAREHEVLSAVAIANDPPGAVCVSSQVWFKALTEQECKAYLTTGESMDKAGSYAIQGYAAAFITRLEGSYSAVMGLPLFETAELLRARGVTLFS